MSEEIRAWLTRFEAVVRACDFDAARWLFAPDAVAFGTRAEKAQGLDRIVAEQWREVWPHIREFRLDDTAVHVKGDTAWVAAIWETTRTGPDGSKAARRGRGTFVLERRDGRWLAVHSHFSLVPEGPQL